MFGVLAYFDEKTEQIIKQLWSELIEQNISFYSAEVKDRRPHITLASYDHFDKERLIEDLNVFYSSRHKLKVTMGTLGTFIKSGALFISPTMTDSLMELHKDHHKKFSELTDKHSLYAPGNWIPHCTIANRLSKEKLAEALLYSTNRLETMHAEITEIGLIELQYREEKAAGVTSLFSQGLI